MFEIKTKIHNRFDVFRKNVKTGEEKQIAFAENVILDQLFTNTLPYQYSPWGEHICFGTGTGTPSESDTALFNKTAELDVTWGEIDYSLWFSDGIVSLRRQVTITETQYNGIFISEIGLGSGQSPIVLTTHAMLQDMNGNPVVIEKTNTDIITFYATVYGYFDREGGAGVYDIPIPTFGSGAVYTSPLFTWLLGRNEALMRPNVSERRYWLITRPYAIAGDIYTFSGMSYSGNGVNMGASFSGANKRLSIAVGRFAAANNNVTLAKAIYLSTSDDGSFAFAIKLKDNPGWAGSPVVGESIGVGDGVTQDFKTVYGNIKPGTAKIYLDGIEQMSGVVVDEEIPASNNITDFVIIKEQTSCKYLPGMTYASVLASPLQSYFIFENPFYATYGLTQLSIGYAKLYCSDDMINWTLSIDSLSSATSNKAVPSGDKNKRYWKFDKTGATNPGSGCQIYCEYSGNNIHFATPPAVGEVITGDYTVWDIIKNANYVVDVNVDIYIDRYEEGY